MVFVSIAGSRYPKCLGNYRVEAGASSGGGLECRSLVVAETKGGV